MGLGEGVLNKNMTNCDMGGGGVKKCRLTSGLLFESPLIYI